MIAFLVSAIRLGMVLLFGTTGEILSEKSGHLNLGTPGVMCVGASCGCYAVSLYLKINGPRITPVIAILIALIATFIGGALMGLLFSFLTVSLRANQNVTGLALTTLGIGISDFMIAKAGTSFGRVSKYFTASLPFAKKLGVVGDLLFSHGFLIYLAIIVAIICSFVLSRTRIGLNLRSVGENPATADAAGINVSLYRYVATCVGCGISSLGGLTFIMDYLNGNWEYCIDAFGWLSIALVIFTVWKPNLAILGSFVFGALYIASSYITGVSFASKELFKLLPYIVTILVLIVTSMRNKKENQPPQSLGLSYFREER